VQQFDIVRNANAASRRQYPYVVVLQHDRISGLPTLVVAPLARADKERALDRLHPLLRVEGEDYRVLTEELAAVRRTTLGDIVASAEDKRYALITAIDQLFTGV
jgi:toxin CcdB